MFIPKKTLHTTYINHAWPIPAMMKNVAQNHNGAIDIWINVASHCHTQLIFSFLGAPSRFSTRSLMAYFTAADLGLSKHMLPRSAKICQNKQSSKTFILDMFRVDMSDLRRFRSMLWCLWQPQACILQCPSPPFLKLGVANYQQHRRVDHQGTHQDAPRHGESNPKTVFIGENTSHHSISSKGCSIQTTQRGPLSTMLGKSIFHGQRSVKCHMRVLDNGPKFKNGQVPKEWLSQHK